MDKALKIFFIAAVICVALTGIPAQAASCTSPCIQANTGYQLGGGGGALTITLTYGSGITSGSVIPYVFHANTNSPITVASTNGGSVHSLGTACLSGCTKTTGANLYDTWGYITGASGAGAVTASQSVGFGMSGGWAEVGSGYVIDGTIANFAYSPSVSTSVSVSTSSGTAAADYVFTFAADEAASGSGSPSASGFTTFSTEPAFPSLGADMVQGGSGTATAAWTGFFTTALPMAVIIPFKPGSSSPIISSLSVSSGPIGTSVTVSGSNFGATQGGSTLKFNGTSAVVTSWGASSLVTTVPSGATSGNVVVNVGGIDSNGAAFTVTGAGGTTYYLATAGASPAGNDSNPGTASQPWLTPAHAVNCGDVLLAQPSTSYAASSFNVAWGAVTCAGANNVAWVKCNSSSLTACQITSGSIAMLVNSSWWGIQGFNISGVSTCIQVSPGGSYGSYTTTHHVIVANDICHNTSGNGFNSNNFRQVSSCGVGGNYGPCASASVDYTAILGNWWQNTANGTGDCYAAFSNYENMNSDNASGTHIIMAGNLVNDTVNGICSGGHTYSGDSFLLDTPDGEQQFLNIAYSGQYLIENNICIYNGGRCFDDYDDYKGMATYGHGAKYVKQNTAYSVMTDSNAWDINGSCAAFVVRQSDNNPGPSPYGGYGGATNVTITRNLTKTTLATNCQGTTVYDIYATYSTNINITDNWSYTASGQYQGTGSNNSGVTTTGNHNGTLPGFASPADPGVPNCASYSTVPACFTAAGVVANFTPSGGAIGYGYQVPGAPNYDPLFPQWLCGVTGLPSGLVTMGCNAATGKPTGVMVLIAM